MNITVYKNFKKRKNSTLLPSGGEVVQNVRLKDSVSIERPTFILDRIDFDINYISAFGKYYFVEDITVLNNTNASYVCVMDLLASYRSDIRSTRALVLRSASDYNEDLRDDLISISTECTQDIRESVTLPFSSSGCYVLGVINDIAPIGATCYYVLTTAQMVAFMSWVANTDGSRDPDLTTWCIMQFGNIFGAIVECFWIPIAPGDIPKQSAGIRIGKFNTGISSEGAINGISPIRKPCFINLTDVLPTDFRKANGYMNVAVFVPGYGNVNIPVDKIYSGLLLDYSIDYITGAVMCNIFPTASGHEECIASLSFRLRADLPISQMNANKVGQYVNAVSGAGKGALGGAVGVMAGIDSAFAGVISTYAQDNINLSGAPGGRAFASELVPFASIQRMATVEPDNVRITHGRPLHEERVLSSLSGYTLCADASVQCSATPSQVAEINSYLNSGIYLE